MRAWQELWRPLADGPQQLASREATTSETPYTAYSYLEGPYGRYRGRGREGRAGHRGDRRARRADRAIRAAGRRSRPGGGRLRYESTGSRLVPWAKRAACAHSERRAFWIGQVPVSNRQWREFIGDGGCQRQELWSARGWAHRTEAGLERSLFWTARARVGASG